MILNQLIKATVTAVDSDLGAQWQGLNLAGKITVTPNCQNDFAIRPHVIHNRERVAFF